MSELCQEHSQHQLNSWSTYHQVPAYPPLEGRDYIRLVEILPAKWGDSTIRIRFLIRHLSSLPAYEALSYVWGSGVTARPVEVEGRADLKVTENLYCFLLELQKSYGQIPFWIDALSINQHDEQERAYMIQRMPEIYRLATRTICWIPASLHPSISRLLGHLLLLRDILKQPSWLPLMSSFSLLVAQFQLFSDEKEPAEGLITDPDPYHSDIKISVMHLDIIREDALLSDQRAWRELNKFLENTYFIRIWIMHDWICSTNLILRCESEELSWDKLCSALEVCLLYCPSGSLSSPAVLNLVSANYLRKRVHWQSGYSLSLDEIIIAQQNVSFKATMMGDHVFALRSMFGPVAHDLGTVAYSLNTAEIFCGASKALGLFTLSHAENQPQSVPEKPSWVTNWNLPRRTFLLNHPRSLFRASGVQNMSSDRPYDLQSKDSMQCVGVELDVAKETSHYLPPRRHCDHYSLEGYNNTTFSQWFEFAKKQRRRPRQLENLDDQILLEFAETIQGRGCNSIWETARLLDDTVETMREFLRYLEEEDAKATSSLRIFYAACFPAHGRKFGVTGQGHFCLVPKDTAQDDRICIPHGSRVPFVFQRKGDDYVNLGECYVHGRMYGEAAANSGGMKDQTFNLV